MNKTFFKYYNYYRMKFHTTCSTESVYPAQELIIPGQKKSHCELATNEDC